MTSGRFVRNATPEDAGRLAEIYNQGIEERIATFETEPRSPAEIAAWFENGYPVFVAGAGDRVMAYSVAYPYRPRRCYEGVREFSIYTAREARGSGFGRAALSALIDHAKARGWWKLLSGFFRKTSPAGRSCSRRASVKSASTKNTPSSTGNGGTW